jgi:hypothetical protein
MGVLDRIGGASTQVGAFASTLLTYLYNNDQAAIDQALTADQGTLLFSALVPETNNFPRFYLAGNNRFGVILVAGLQNLPQAISLVNGYLLNAGDNDTAPINPWLQNVANVLLAEAKQKGVFFSGLVLMAGHSAGGAICSYSQFLTNQWVPRPIVEVQTFGAPKAMNYDAAQSVASEPIVRWMYSFDPVPLLPFRVGDTALWPLGATRQMLIRAGRFCHTRGGYQVDGLGGGAGRELPDNARANPVASVSAWVLSMNDPTNAYHSMTFYRVYVNLFMNSHPTAETTHLRTAPVEPPENVTTQQRTQSEVAFSQTIYNLEAEQNSAPLVIPEPRVFSAGRVGRTWYVYLGDTPIAIAASKRGARALARDFNASFRRLQRLPIVDVAGLTHGLDDYLEAASDPAGGFSPVMNTVLPNPAPV